MAKKLGGWHRLFIVFAVVWTVLSIGILSFILYDYNLNVQYPTIQRTEIIIKLKKLMGRPRESNGIVNNQGEPVDIQREHKLQLREYYKGRRNAIFYFPLYWLAPIGFVYGMGRTTWWIIRGFRKEN